MTNFLTRYLAFNVLILCERKITHQNQSGTFAVKLVPLRFRSLTNITVSPASATPFWSKCWLAAPRSLRLFGLLLPVRRLTCFQIKSGQRILL
jgi:hypothetical protein